MPFQGGDAVLRILGTLLCTTLSAAAAGADIHRGARPLEDCLGAALDPGLHLARFRVTCGLT